MSAAQSDAYRIDGAGRIIWSGVEHGHNGPDWVDVEQTYRPNATTLAEVQRRQRSAERSANVAVHGLFGPRRTTLDYL